MKTVILATMLLALPIVSDTVAAHPAHGSGSACYWLTGRLFYSNGTPSVRIWPRGTKRLLGVLTPKSESESDHLLPKNVMQLEPSFEQSIWGQFHVCPLSPERSGWMRMVSVRGARKLSDVPYRG